MSVMKCSHRVKRPGCAIFELLIVLILIFTLSGSNGRSIDISVISLSHAIWASSIIRLVSVRQPVVVHQRLFVGLSVTKHRSKTAKVIKSELMSWLVIVTWLVFCSMLMNVKNRTAANHFHIILFLAITDEVKERRWITISFYLHYSGRDRTE